MATQNHPNSKKITIYRAGSFIDDAQTQAQEFMALSKKSIGSYYAGSNKKGIGSGLSFSEIDALMPDVLDLPKEDRTFRQRVKEYFTQIVTKIPYGTGLELEIGLSESNSKPVSDTNRPLEVSDYIRYKHALGHPRVAQSRNEAKGNMLIEFYIFDKEAATSEGAGFALEKDQALTAYLGVKEDEGKVNMLLTLLKVDPKDPVLFTGKNAASLRVQKLREIADTRPADFLKVTKYDNFDIRYKIQAMLNAGILKTIGGAIADKETNKIIGHSMDEAIVTFLNPAESQLVTILSVKLQEANKDLVTASKKVVEKVEKKKEEVPTTE